MDVNIRVLLVLGFMLHVVLASGYEFDPDYLIPPKCKPCNAKSCPKLIYCAGEVVTDNCGCCPRCSSGLFQPHVADSNPDDSDVNTTSAAQQKVDVCQQRKCPKFKVCLLNMQGLPLCTCPSPKVCDKRRRGKRANQLLELEICGSDGNTYPSKCHLRLANCNSLKRIKRIHLGPCRKTENDFGGVGNIGIGDLDSGPLVQSTLTKKEERARLKALKKAKRKKMKKRKRKNRRLRKKEKLERKQREKNRKRSKRRNNVFNPYSSHYDFLLRKHTNWGHNQVRKSRI